MRIGQAPSSADEGGLAPSRTLSTVAPRAIATGSNSAAAYHRGATRQRTIDAVGSSHQPCRQLARELRRPPRKARSRRWHRETVRGRTGATTRTRRPARRRRSGGGGAPRTYGLSSLLPSLAVFHLAMMPPREAWRSRLKLIHPSAWKVNSTNFAITEFYELRVYGVLGSSAQARSWMSSITVPSSLNRYTTLVPAKDPSE